MTHPAGPIPYATPAHFASPTAGSPPPLAAAAPGLSPEQFAQLNDARRRAARIRRGVAVATFDGWATAIFAGLTFVGGALHWVGFVLGAAMGVVAWVEFRGAARLKQLDPQAPKILAWNQVGLGLALLAYAAYSLWGVMYHRSELAAQLSGMGDAGQFAELGIDIESLERTIGLLVYGTLAAVAIFGQGGTALFYLSRRKHVEAYLRETPQWITDAQRAGMPM